MKIILVLLLGGFCGTTIAQTKLIFHKSHSGSSLNYVASLSSNPSNFGVVPARYVTRAALDSVIFVSDSMAIMVTSEYCYDGFRRYRITNDSTASDESVWNAGRDTVYNHPLFSKRHALDSIKAVLFASYYFQNNMDSTKFIGYDNKESVRIPESDLPAGGRRKQNDLYLLLLFVSGIFVFSFLFSRPFHRLGDQHVS